MTKELRYAFEQAKDQSDVAKRNLEAQQEFVAHLPAEILGYITVVVKRDGESRYPILDCQIGGDANVRVAMMRHLQAAMTRMRCDEDEIDAGEDQ